MAAPFLRIVESVDALAKDGITVEFFAGPDYKLVPQGYVEAIKDFCLRHLKTEEISKPSSDDVDKLAPFVLRLGDKKADELTREFLDLVEREILQSIDLAATKIVKSRASAERQNSTGLESTPVAAVDLALKASSVGAILDRDLDEAFDTLRSASELRDYFLHLKSFAKRQAKAGNKSAALIIEA